MAQGDDDSIDEERPSEAVDRLLTEALLLVEATKRYLEGRPQDLAGTPAELHHVREIERITTRLGHVVGWLLACKAQLASGPCQPARQAMLRGLGSEAHCMERPEVAGLPLPLQGLLHASANLYGRAIRLASSGSDLAPLH
jgi:hypothetical protein